MPERDAAIAWVERFLERNYSAYCSCGEPDCPGNYFEAATIVEGVLERVKGALDV